MLPGGYFISKGKKEMTRFSILIPAYNSRKCIGALLDSLVKQKYRDLEVIIADDRSTEPYDDIVAPYEEKLNIVKTTVKEGLIHCPGNTRQAALEKAQGDWLIFADHDDKFTPRALERFSGLIDRNPDAVVISSQFDEVLPDGRVVKHYETVHGWTHGQAYKREFVEKYNINFITDASTGETIPSHEDILWSSRVTCALNMEHKQPILLNSVTYNWTCHPESVSRSEKGLFIANHLDEYVRSTGYVYLDHYKKYGEPEKEFAKYHSIAVILYCYGYQMGEIFRKSVQNQGKSINYDNFTVAKEYVQELEKTLNLTNGEVLSYCSRDMGSYYWRTMENATIATGYFIPWCTLEQYLAFTGIQEEENG